MRSRAFFFAALLLTSNVAHADAHDDARAEFQAGLAAFDKKDFATALAAFRRSRALFATRGARENEAACLRELARYDEAVELFDELGNTAESARVARFTGWLDVNGDAGARVFIDGRDRGVLPSARMRVNVGTRHVRVEKSGYSSFETTMLVASGETRAISVTLSIVALLGRLRVLEKSGGRYDVRIDGVAVGRTPWEGDVSTGEHVVAIAGANDIGAPARAVRVTTAQTESIELVAAPLPAELRIEPTPPNANVRIDQRASVTGTFAGTLPSGHHDVVIDSPWYVPAHREVVLSSLEPRELRVVLDPIRRVTIELFGGLTVFPSWGAPAIQSCSTCVGYLYGLRAGYLVTRHVGIELFFVPQSDFANTATGPTQPLDASITLSAGGTSVKLEYFERTPLVFRLWAGAALAYAAGARYFTPMGAAEVRFGYRVAKLAVIDIGVAALFFSVPAGRDYVGTDGNVEPITSAGLGAGFPITLGVRADL